MPYDAVIFDLGGVILDIDYQATETALARLAAPSGDAPFSHKAQSPLFDDFETGRISEDHFLQGLQGLLGTPVSHSLLIQAWDAMLGESRPERIEFLRRVGQKRRIFLLSNTNGIHKRAFDRIISPLLPQRTFDDLFEGAYYSHLLGLRKPDPRAFTHIVSSHGLDPSKTLFIDDSPQHVAGARRAGLSAHHLTSDLLTDPVVLALLTCTDISQT